MALVELHLLKQLPQVLLINKVGYVLADQLAPGGAQDPHGGVVDEYYVSVVIGQHEAVGRGPNCAEEPGVVKLEKLLLRHVIQVQDQPLDQMVVDPVVYIALKVDPCAS